MKTPAALPALLAVVVIALAGCETPTAANLDKEASDIVVLGQPGEVLYFNSFEASSDTAAWDGFGMLELRDDIPADGGQKSAYVSGGCPYPHSAVVFAAEAAGKLELRAWAKDLAIGGAVLLENLDSGDQVYLAVNTPAWTLVTAANQLAVNPGDALRLSMDAGGFAPSAMLVDLLEVRYAQ